MEQITEETIATGKSSDLSVLQKELSVMGVGINEFFLYLRVSYLKKHLNGSMAVFAEKVLGTSPKKFLHPSLPSEKRKQLDNFIKSGGHDWGDIDFHIKYRAKTAEDLFSVFKLNGELHKLIKRGYALSILPLNIVLADHDLLNKFIPKKDFFTDHFAKSWDPYGIFTKGAKIFKGNQYLASQKFKRSILMNITSACPIGCVGCYKGEFTRRVGKRFFTDLSKAASTQSKNLVNYLNKNREIKAVIISGGEPLLLPNKGIEKMLRNFSKAKFLVEIRLCTGTIFQGLPFRIDNELLGILEKFEKQTGIRIHFNAHLSHPVQFSPEALIAINRILKKGFLINSQLAMQRGVNIFPNNFKKTVDTLFELARLQGASGVRAFKYILHMNVGSLEYSVPLEFMLKVLAELKYRIDHPFPETWQPVSYTILCKQGNILLSPQLLFIISKKILKYKDSVEYFIPVPISEQHWEIVKYVEPLLKGYNDDPNSLSKIRASFDAALKNMQGGRALNAKFVC